MSFDDVWQLPNPSNPSGVLSGYQQVQITAVRSFNAATTSMGLVNAMHNTPVDSGGLSASTIPTAMPTATADFEKPDLAVRLYNQLELLGLPNWAELCYISENLALMCTHGTIKTFSPETFSQLQIRLIQFDPAHDGDPPAWATPSRLPDGADGFDLYRIRIEIGGRCFATTNWHPFLSLPRALAERIEYILTVVNANWRRKGWVARDSRSGTRNATVKYGPET
ncbi:hypothetical protein E8E11_008900 [Didymella keratinophila]|nr:hypothetical protein E8E11_008900 [Didymella keratinophila]